MNASTTEPVPVGEVVEHGDDMHRDFTYTDFVNTEPMVHIVEEVEQ